MRRCRRRAKREVALRALCENRVIATRYESHIQMRRSKQEYVVVNSHNNNKHPDATKLTSNGNQNIMLWLEL